MATAKAERGKPVLDLFDVEPMDLGCPHRVLAQQLDEKGVALGAVTFPTVAVFAALRRAEAVALDLADHQPDDGQLQVRRVKGRKARTVYIAGGAVDALEAWIALRGDVAGPLLCPVDKAGRIRHVRLSGQAIRELLARRARKAQVAHFAPHDVRRTTVSVMLEAGIDIATVQRIAGHANIATTARYDRRPEAVKRQAAGMLHVPYIAPQV